MHRFSQSKNISIQCSYFFPSKIHLFSQIRRFMRRQTLLFLIKHLNGAMTDYSHYTSVAQPIGKCDGVSCEKGEYCPKGRWFDCSFTCCRTFVTCAHIKTNITLTNLMSAETLVTANYFRINYYFMRCFFLQFFTNLTTTLMFLNK